MTIDQIETELFLASEAHDAELRAAAEAGAKQGEAEKAAADATDVTLRAAWRDMQKCATQEPSIGEQFGRLEN